MKQPKTFQEAANLVAQECLKVMYIKQNDYGPDNILDLGEKGVFVRTYDKLKRLKRIVWEGRKAKVSDEKIDDTWIDTANYAMIALMVRKGWFGLPLEDE